MSLNRIGKISKRASYFVVLLLPVFLCVFQLSDALNCESSWRSAKGFAALKKDGTVLAWGSDDPSLIALPPGLNKVVAVFSTFDAYAALKNDGTVVAWGQSDYGGVAPLGLTNVTDIYASNGAFVARKADGTIHCWGGGSQGITVPAGLSDVAKIFPACFPEKESHFTALRSDGSIIHFGSSEVFIPTTLSDPNPENPVINVIANDGGFTALRRDGTIVSFGDVNSGGSAPSNIRNVKKIISSVSAFAVIHGDSEVTYWPEAQEGTAPIIIGGAVDIFSNGWAFAVLNLDGSVVSWGGRPSPGVDCGNEAPEGLNDVLTVSASACAFTALKRDGKIISWGSPEHGGVSPTGLTEVIQVVGNKQSFAALRRDGTVVTWPLTLEGSSAKIPVPTDLNGVVAIYNNAAAFAALKADGTIATFGSSYFGANSPSGIDNVAQVYGTTIYESTPHAQGSHVYACPAGQYGLTSNRCKLCAPGKYSINPQATVEATCMPCPAQQQSFSGATACYQASYPNNIRTLTCNEIVDGHLFVPAAYVHIAGKDFQKCRGLTSITFESGSSLKTIGISAFELDVGACSLTSVILPASLESIGDYAFYGCPLISITIEANSNLERIGRWAFYGSKITTFNVPAKLRVIDANAFSEIEDLTSVTFDPESGLKSLGAGAFKATQISSIVFPSTLESVGYYAFADSTSLSSVNFQCASPPSPLQIGDLAFMNTPYAIDQVVPDASCRLIQFPLTCKDVVNGNLFVPASYVGIADKAFAKCSNLISITFEAGSNLKQIGSKAFLESNLVSINVPASLESIGTEAFEGCSNLVSVTFEAGSSLVHIFARAFRLATALTSISMPASLHLVGDHAFQGASLATVAYACRTSQHLFISRNAFSDTPYETNGLVFPDPVCRTVRHGSGCYAGLSLDDSANGDVILPATLTSLLDQAYDRCLLLMSIHFAANSQLQSIGTFAFREAINLRSFEIPASVLVIGSQAFRDTASLASITFACSPTPLRVGIDAFANSLYNTNGKIVPDSTCREVQFALTCDDVVDGILHVPASYLAIENEAFMSCTKLKSVTFEAGSVLHTIGKRAFYGCRLSPVVLPASLLHIEEEAFYNSQVLRITFEENSQLQSIGRYAFRRSKLTQIELPSSVVSISAAAFSDSKILETITFSCSSALLKVGVSAFAGTPYTRNGAPTPDPECKHIQFALSCFDVKDTYVKNGGHIVFPASHLVVEDDAFNSCTELTSIAFAEDSQLEQIGRGAFAGSSLESISLPASLISVAQNAFLNSAALMSVSFSCSSHVLWIHADAFEGSGVTRLFLPLSAIYAGSIPVTVIACPDTETTLAYPTFEPTLIATSVETKAQKYCGGGQYVKNKKTDRESCGSCPAGRFSKETTLRNRRCKKCAKNSYSHSPGSSKCFKCPAGFNTKGQRGKRQCFKKGTEKSMKKLGWNFSSTNNNKNID